MKRLLILAINFVIFNTVLFSNSVYSYAEELTYEHNEYDYSVIPDDYNTGCKGELTYDYDYFVGSYPEDDKAFYVSYKIQDKYGTTLENIEFTRNIIIGQANQRSMVFKNCKFNTTSTYAVSTYNGSNWTEDVTCTFINCTFTNYGSAAVQTAPNVKFLNCKFYEAQGDGAKGGYNMHYENCYFYNIGFAEGAHADGIQWTQGTDGSQVINCRFDMPYYDKYIPNAAIFFMLEQGADGSNNVLKNIYATGGNYTVYYGAKDTENSIIENTTIENINIGCSYQYGAYNANYPISDEEIKNVDKLFVSSVYQEDSDSIKLYTTNYTNQEKKLICITDAGTEEFTIPACPLHEEALTNYTSLSQFPFNVEIELNGSEYVVCYSDEQTVENQIRYVNFSEEEIPSNPEQLPESPVQSPGSSSDGNIDFKANIDSWFEVKIPNSYKLTDLTNELEFSVSGDIAGDKLLSVTTEESIVLKNANEDELVATLNMTKKSFAFAELKDITDSAIVIEVEKLPAGRFVGEMPVYVSIIDAEESIPDGVITGQINETVNFKLENGIFTVSGTGRIPNYSTAYDDYKEDIQIVVVEDGIECLALKNFLNCPNLETVYLGNTVTDLGGYVFQNCANLKSIYMPTSVTQVGNICPNQNTSTTLYYAGTEEQFNQIVGVENLTHLTILYEQTW